MNKAFEGLLIHSLANDAQMELLIRASKEARIHELTDEQLHELVRKGEELSKQEAQELNTASADYSAKYHGTVNG